MIKRLSVDDSTIVSGTPVSIGYAASVVNITRLNSQLGYCCILVISRNLAT
jgi:hypothetical protein